MKRNYLYYLLVVMLLVASCEKDEMACTTSVETQEVSSIAATTAKCGGIISSDGNPTIKEAGVEWCITGDFETNVSCSLADKAELGKFACEITDLKDNTQYYVRAYARNSYGTIYGKVLSFKTLEIVLPVVLTDSATNISTTSAAIGGEVTDDGNGVVTERGVVYSTNPNPTIENNKVVCGSGKGAFSCNLTDLQDGSIYYVRAYAVNQKGTAYGEEKSFTTTAIIVPSVTTSSATNISYTSASVGGNVTDDGGSNVTARGIVYSTTPNPTTANSKVVSGSGKGAFTCNLSNLQAGVKYYIRAYAANQKGTAYGEEKSFTTKAITLPTVTTSPATNILSTSATVGGNVTDDGGSNVTARGIVYSTTPNPTTANNKVASGSGKGAFTCNLSNLQAGVKYYIRAYAVNQKGTAYGEEKSFTTKAISVPTVTTSSASNISSTSASVSGNVTDDGGANVTERGVVYSTSKNPTTSNTKKVSGSGTGAYSVKLSGLFEGTTYYVRAYAINSKGTAYGEEKSFTTLENSSSDPTVKVVTIQQFINASVSDQVYYELTGTITDLANTTYGNFDLTDETGTVYVWGVTKSFIALGSTTNDQSFASLGLEEGDKITIRGFRGSNKYNGTPEVHGAYFVKLVSKGDGGNTETQPKTIVFDADVDQGDAGTDSNNAASYTITKDGVTITVSQGIIGTYNSGNHYRVYKNHTLTLNTNSGSIKSVEFTCTANGDEKYGPGGFTVSTGNYGHNGGAVGTWTGNANKVVFTASSNQVRTTEIKVVVE